VREIEGFSRHAACCWPAVRNILVASTLAVLVLAEGEASAQVAGLNLGAPVYGGQVTTDLDAVLATGAPYVRVNFRLDQWSSPGDTTKVNGKTFFEAYDGIVDAIVSQGLEVYGLLNDELAPGAAGTQAFEDAYAANVAAVVEHFRDRVRVFETINEPNDYAGGTSARFPPAAFARAHARAYDAVKGQHPDDACWGVTLVTGPLFSFDDTSAADYLDQAIAAGRAGGPWKTLRDALGRDPIDDVGYHLYVAQGSDSPLADVGVKANANLSAVKATLANRGITGKRFWVSEIGFQVPAVTEQEQADRLDATFASLGARGDVASILWFTIADFGGSGWGLYRDDVSKAANRRPAYDRFVAQAKAHAPELAARLDVSLPKQVTAGATVHAKITATNLGKATWSAADQVRLGAASGCPSAWATNGWTWTVASADGYATSATDARRFLDASVAQGAATTFDVTLVAPSAPGKVRFAARMVKEGEAWFGGVAIADVDIVSSFSGDADAGPLAPGPSPGGEGTGAPPAASHGGESGGCGCRAAGGSSSGTLPALALATAIAHAWRRRARRTK
jgi:hypothetical protein